MDALSNFTVTVYKSKVVYFFQAQWRAVRVVWGIDGTVANQEMTVCGCTAPWYWTMTCMCCKFPFILASFEP